MAAAFALASVGCEEKPAKKSTSSSKTKPDDKPVLDPKLGKIIAASSASAKAQKDQQPTRAEGTPPPTGVFTSAEAEAAHGQGKPIHVEPGTAGSAPLVSVIPTSTKLPKTITMSVSTMMGARQSFPSMDMTFQLKADKPKKTENEVGKTQPISVMAKLTKATLSTQQPGQVPPQAIDFVSQMKGSTLGWSLLPEGGVSTLTLKRSPKMLPELEHNLVAVAETIAAASIVAPKEPLGAGAAWIARSRDTYGGLDVVSYRMYQLVKVEGEKLTISVELRQYVVGETIAKSGLPEGAEVVQFQSTGSGKFVVTRGSSFADQGKLMHTMSLGLRTSEAQPNQIMPLTFRSTVTFPVSK